MAFLFYHPISFGTDFLNVNTFHCTFIPYDHTNVSMMTVHKSCIDETQKVLTRHNSMSRHSHFRWCLYDIMFWFAWYAITYHDHLRWYFLILVFARSSISKFLLPSYRRWNNNLSSGPSQYSHLTCDSVWWWVTDCQVYNIYAPDLSRCCSTSLSPFSTHLRFDTTAFCKPASYKVHPSHYPLCSWCL